MEAKSKRNGRPAAVRSEGADPTEVTAVSAETPTAAVRQMKRAPVDLGQAALAAWGESQSAAARGFDALSAEMAGLARTGIENAAHSANRMLAVKTLSDAVEVAAGFARTSLESAVSGSAKLSELGVRMAAEMSAPLLDNFAKNWAKAGPLGG